MSLSLRGGLNGCACGCANNAALHFAALTSKADTGGAWAKVLLEHGSPIVRDLFGATALHLAAAHVNVGGE